MEKSKSNVKRASKASDKSKQTSIAASRAKPRKLMVLYGYIDGEKHRAGYFKEKDFDLARKAARTLKLNVHVVPYERLEHVLGSLVKPGRIHASGPRMLPIVNELYFSELLVELGLKPLAEEQHPREWKLPRSWDDIEVGHTVLGQADSTANGWWPAVVEIIEGDMLHVRAHDFPEVKVQRHRSAVALLHTAEYVAPKIGQGQAAPGLPKDWASLEAAHLVLAEAGRGEGWWEAIVDSVNIDEVALRWRDYPKEPRFERARTAVALLNPIVPK